jgi:hypothetical protein
LNIHGRLIARRYSNPRALKKGSACGLSSFAERVDPGAHCLPGKASIPEGMSLSDDWHRSGSPRRSLECRCADDLSGDWRHGVYAALSSAFNYVARHRARQMVCG